MRGGRDGSGGTKGVSTISRWESKSSLQAEDRRNDQALSLLAASATTLSESHSPCPFTLTTSKLSQIPFGRRDRPPLFLCTGCPRRKSNNFVRMFGRLFWMKKVRADYMNLDPFDFGSFQQINKFYIYICNWNREIEGNLYLSLLVHTKSIQSDSSSFHICFAYKFCFLNLSSHNRLIISN